MKKKEIEISPLFTFEAYKKVSKEERKKTFSGEHLLFKAIIFNEETKKHYFYLYIVAKNFKEASIRARLKCEQIEKSQQLDYSLNPPLWNYKNIFLDKKFDLSDDTITFSFSRVTDINVHLVEEGIFIGEHTEKAYLDGYNKAASENDLMEEYLALGIK